MALVCDSSVYGVTASKRLMVKTLAMLNLTHKKRRFYAAEQARADVAAARAAWRDALPKLDVGKLIFLDETWTSTAMMRLYSRAVRGQRLVDRVPHGHWKISTFVAGLRHDGMVAPCVIDGAPVPCLCRASSGPRAAAWRHSHYGQPQLPQDRRRAESDRGCRGGAAVFAAL